MARVVSVELASAQLLADVLGRLIVGVAGLARAHLKRQEEVQSPALNHVLHGGAALTFLGHQRDEWVLTDLASLAAELGDFTVTQRTLKHLHQAGACGPVAQNSNVFVGQLLLSQELLDFGGNWWRNTLHPLGQRRQILIFGNQVVGLFHIGHQFGSISLDASRIGTLVLLLHGLSGSSQAVGASSNVANLRLNLHDAIGHLTLDKILHVKASGLNRIGKALNAVVCLTQSDASLEWSRLHKAGNACNLFLVVREKLRQAVWLFFWCGLLFLVGLQLFAVELHGLLVRLSCLRTRI